MTMGDLVLVNILMIQLYIHLNFLGVIYREIKHALTDMDRIFSFLGTNQEIADDQNAVALSIANQSVGRSVVFDQVSFSYEPARGIIKNTLVLKFHQARQRHWLGIVAQVRVPWLDCY